MYGIIMGLFMVVAIALVIVILVQQGKGAVLGASFGAGASNTVFGASGSGGFLVRLTTILAVIFFGLALGIGVMTSAGKKGPSTDSGDVFSQAVEASKAAPAPTNSDVPSLSPAAEPAATSNSAAAASDVPSVSVETSEKKAAPAKADQATKNPEPASEKTDDSQK